MSSSFRQGVNLSSQRVDGERRRQFCCNVRQSFPPRGATALGLAGADGSFQVFITAKHDFYMYTVQFVFNEIRRVLGRFLNL